MFAVRWLFHIVSQGTLVSGTYRPPSLAREKFIHASYKDQVAESARAHFPADARLSVLQIDPRRVEAPIRVDPTPRGPMPHIYGTLPSEAIRAVLTMGEVEAAPDDVKETRFAFVAFEGMTLLDLVGIDTTYYIANIMFDEFREKRFAPPPLMKRMVLAGFHGRKTGKGFYDYASEPAKPNDFLTAGGGVSE
jgi:uncharacterized protein (DUF952 family)